MKKSFVFLLLALAVIVLISPGIVGRLAEKSMDENLDWAATESEELQVTALGFERGWFSSEGQHRIEISEGELRDSLLAISKSAGELPALIIDTHIDHGLVPVGSIGREKGSLAPGLGSAVSTLSLEFKSGETIELPGTIYSNVGLTGELESNLLVEPGSVEVDSETAHWGGIDILVTTSPTDSAVSFSGIIEQLLLVSATNEIGLSNIEFDGEQAQTRYGFSVGDANLVVETLSFPSSYGQADTGPWRIMSEASLDGELLSARTAIETEYIPLGELGPTGIAIDISIEGVDAAAIGSISKTLDEIETVGSGDELMVAIEDDLQQLLATGFSMRVDRLELAMPPGKIETTLDAVVAPTNADQFIWASLFGALDAELQLSVPVEFYDYLVTLDPQVSMAVGMGFLRKSGNFYEMEAAFNDGLLTVNGAPMPIPLPGGN